jgi:hypothetical protein
MNTAGALVASVSPVVFGFFRAEEILVCDVIRNGRSAATAS